MYSQTNRYANESTLVPILIWFPSWIFDAILFTLYAGEMEKSIRQQKRCRGAIITDFSKAFDCINHELLISKLEAHTYDREKT